MCASNAALIPPQASIVQLLVRIPEIWRGNPNNAAAEPPACVSMQEASSVRALPQVVYLFMNHHCSSYYRQAPEHCGRRLYHGVDFPFLGLEVTEVSRVVGVMHTVWIVVASGGLAAPAQVSVLMDVHRSGFWPVLSGETVEPEEDFEFSLRVILPKKSLAVHFGEALE